MLHLPQGPNTGVNPRGLLKDHICQMDVTHYNSFGRLGALHVSIDTFSKVLWATASTGEMAKQVINHCLAAFAVMGIPKIIKTDNGPAYTSCQFQEFCKR